MRTERPHYSPIHTLDNQSAHVNNPFKDKKPHKNFIAFHLWIQEVNLCSPRSMQLIPLSRYLQRSCALQTQNCTRMRMERPHYSPIHTLDNQSAHVNNTFKDKKIEQEFHSIPILLNPTAWHIYIYICMLSSQHATNPPEQMQDRYFKPHHQLPTLIWMASPDSYPNHAWIKIL